MNASIPFLFFLLEIFNDSADLCNARVQNSLNELIKSCAWQKIERDFLLCITFVEEK
jgi:hypothetical protein